MSTVPQRLGRYELRQPLGRGNVGEVWKAFDLQLRREVAIKIIHSDLQADPSFLARFTQEGQAIASLHHANIAQIHEVNFSRPAEDNNTTAYIVSEYVEGETLGDYMNRTSRKGDFLPVADIVYLFTSLGVAIDYAHQKGIVHGSIKPANILLDKRNTAQFVAGEPTLTDFALARLLGGAASVGTPLYMSPEQAKGYSANNRSDIYSLGVILYEMCTGIQPFRDDSSVAVLMQHINTLPTPPNLINHNIPQALSEVILRAMAKDTVARFSMASLLATAIADACSMQSTIHIAPDRSILEEDELTTSGSHSSLLGVSQPLSKAQPSQPLPKTQPTQTTQPRLPQVSRPMPAVTAPLPLGNGSATKPAAYMPAQIAQTPAPTPQPNKVLSSPLPDERSTFLVAASSAPLAPITSGPLAPPPMLPAAPSVPAIMPPPIPPRSRGRLRANDASMYVVIGVLFLVLIVIGTAIGGSLLLSNKGGTPASSVAGHVFFQDDALGHADQLRITMQNIAAPSQGKTYFAWLKDTNNHLTPLGALSAQNGTFSYLYLGTAQHTNLLSIIRGVTVTLEDSGSSPTAPHGTTVYQASINTAAFPYIKNILYQMPGSPASNGIVVNMFETIKSMNDKTGSISDSIGSTLDYGLVGRQATRVIEMIDGQKYARSSGDLPAKYPSFIDSQVGIISSASQQGYLDALADQIQHIRQVVGNNTTIMQHANNVQNAITDLQGWIEQIRIDDVTILKAPTFNNPQIINTALQLKQETSDAYTGKVIPPAEEAQNIVGSAGALQAYVECLYMATLDLQPA